MAAYRYWKSFTPSLSSAGYLRISKLAQLLLILSSSGSAMGRQEACKGWKPLGQIRK